MAELKFIVTMDSSQFTEGANKVMADVKQITSSVEKEGGKIQSQFDGIGKSIGGSMSKYLAMFGGAAALKGLLTEMVKVRSEFQKTDVAIRTMLGSKEKADELMNQVREYAKISPLEIGDITKATQMMISFNIEADKVPQYIKAIGDVSMGEKDRFNSLALAFSQMSATGKLMGQDLLQMINAGFNPLATISDKTGKSIAQLKDEMSKGAISAKMVQDAFIAATSAGGKFYGMSENAAKTIGGQLSMLSDAVAAAFNEVGEKSEGIITTAISGVTKLVENYEAVAKAIGILIATYGTYKAALITMMAIEQAHGVAAAAAAVKTELLAKKQAVLNAVMNANPYALAAAALATLVGAIVSAATATDAFDDAADSLSEAQASIEAATSAEMSKLDALNKKLIEAGEGTDEYKRIKQQIIDQYSQYYAGLETEWSKVGNLVLMYDKLTLAIRKSIAARQMKSIVDKQLDATDKIVQDKLDKAYKKLIEKYGNERGTELYKKFFEFATLGNGKGLNAKDWKDLEDATMWTTRWGKNATDGIVDFRVSVKELAYDIQKANKASQQFVENLKDLYDVEEEAPEPTTPKVITPTYDTKATAAAKKAAESAAKERERQAREQAKEREKLAEIYAHQLTDEGRRNADIEFETRELEIKALKDGTEKTIREIELSHDKELSAITRWYEDIRQKRIDEAKKVFDAKAANQGKNFFDSEEYKKASSADAYTKQEKDALERRLDAANTIYKNALADIVADEQRSMLEYLSQYGTYQERRLAIAKEYAEKIADAQAKGDKGEEKRLAKERDNRLGEINAKNLAMSIDWGAAFRGVGNVLGDIARETLQKVEEYMKTAEFRGLDATNKKSYIDLRDRLREETGAGAASPFNFKQWGKIEEQVNEYKDNVRRLNIAQRAHTEAVNELEKAQERLKSAVDEREKQEAKVAVAAAQTAVDITAANQNSAQGAVEESQANLTSSTNAAAQGIDNFSSYLNEMKNGSLYGFANGITKLITSLKGGSDGVGKALGELGGKIGGLIGAILQIIDALGDDPAGFIGGLLDNVGDAVEKILADLPKLIGNIAEGVVGIVKGIFAGIGAWFSHGTENQAARTTERLTESNNALRTSIDKLTDEFKKQAGGEAIKQYQKALANQEAYNKNQQDILMAQMRKYGKHRSNAYYLSGELSSADYRAISGAIKKNISSLQGLFNLSPEDVDKIRAELPALWTRIISAGKYDDVKDYWNAYADEAGKTKELTDLINENLTQVSFDSMFSSFEDTLMDMGASAADWGNKFSEMLQKSLLHFALGDEFQEKMNKWYQSWADTMKKQNGELTENQIDLYRQEWDAFLQEGIEKRNAIAKLTGYTGSDSEGSGAYKAAQSFSQEQGDELNGRLTAIQIGQAYQNEQLTMAVMTLQSMSVVGQEQGNTLAEMRNLMLIGNGHLEDIARYTKIAAQYGDAIETIADKIKTL